MSTPVVLFELSPRASGKSLMCRILGSKHSGACELCRVPMALRVGRLEFVENRAGHRLPCLRTCGLCVCPGPQSISCSEMDGIDSSVQSSQMCAVTWIRADGVLKPRCSEVCARHTDTKRVLVPEYQLLVIYGGRQFPKRALPIYLKSRSSTLQTYPG